MVRKQFVHPVFKTAQWAFLIFGCGGMDFLPVRVAGLTALYLGVLLEMSVISYKYKVLSTVPGT